MRKPTVENFQRLLDSLISYGEIHTTMLFYPKKRKNIGPKAIFIPEASPKDIYDYYVHGLVDTLYINGNNLKEIQEFPLKVQGIIKSYKEVFSKERELFLRTHSSYPIFDREQKLLVPSITVAQLGVSNHKYPDKEEKIERTTPTMDDLAFSLSEVCRLASTKIGCSKGAVNLPVNVSITAVIAFGDSYLDQGNNNKIKTVSRANFPPYGKDFIAGKPTGRFSNGKSLADFFVEALGVKEYLPAYLDPSVQYEDLQTGVSFASGGTGYDPVTPKILSVIPLSDQLQMFKQYIIKLKRNIGDEAAHNIITNSVVLISASTNDLILSYYDVPIRRIEYDVHTYVNMLANLAINFVQDIHKLGARRIAVLSAPPVGCLPAQRTLAGGVLRECSEKENQAARLFNIMLKQQLHSLESRLPQSRVAFVDFYNPLISIIENPHQYGLEVTDKGCCGTGKLEEAFLLRRRVNFRQPNSDGLMVFRAGFEGVQGRLITANPTTAKSSWDHVESIFLDNKRTRIIALKGSYAIHGLSDRFAYVASIKIHREPFPDLNTMRFMVTTEEMQLNATSQTLPSNITSSAPQVMLAETSGSRRQESRTPRDTRSNTRTFEPRICQNFTRGFCRWGITCKFIHDSRVTSNASSNTSSNNSQSGKNTSGHNNASSYTTSGQV
ncbi:GDSL esterase/lipase-like protein [Tanacetum coccineum]|uniref:GDSL esterase/lipase-like protein n=1 Tax=Tanacetum coccineum TaxID=301880 RepID=A0ABQ5HNH4_9ASTR